jgi:hypothetical protein
VPGENGFRHYLQNQIILQQVQFFLAHELRTNRRGQKISQSKFRAEPGIRRNDELADGIVPIGGHRDAAARPARASAPPPPANPMRHCGAANGEN